MNEKDRIKSAIGGNKKELTRIKEVLAKQKEYGKLIKRNIQSTNTTIMFISNLIIQQQREYLALFNN